jgi:hypothetical protein
LNDLILAKQPAKDAKLVAMDDILGIVERDRGGAPALRRLFTQQRFPQPVEAIRLGRRTLPRIDHQPHPCVAFGDGGHRVDRRAVVGIGADVEPEVIVAEPRQRRRQHPPDHVRLVPGRHEDRDTTGRHGRQIGGAQLRPAAEAAKPIDRVEREVVDPADQKADTGQDNGLARQHVDHRNDNPQQRSPDSPMT